MSIATENRAIDQETTTLPFTVHHVASADGTTIGYYQTGYGPGIVAMHGGVRAAHHYFALAQALAGSYTIYLPDRRGRGLSGPPGNNYSLEKELADLQAVLQATGASYLFGHSAGGFFALEAALRLSIHKLVLYEPAVSIHGSMALSWFPAYERAVARNDPATALVKLFKGLQIGWMSSLPDWVLNPFVHLMLLGQDGKDMKTLLPTGVWEINEFLMLENLGLTYERYQAISARSLLLCGSRSPAYLRTAARELSKTIPQAKVVELTGLDHNAPDQNAPLVVASELMTFFS